MKMKKPSSMTTVLSRTCPLCFTMVDPVWYGWHISKCTAYNSQDMALSTILMKNEAHNSQLVVATCEEGSASLPEACTISLAPDSQFVDENSREENPKRSAEINEHGLIHLRTEKQALSDKVKDLELQLEKLECQLNAEKQALADKVKCLELNVEELECQLRLSKESERKALCLVESLQGSGEENGLINGASQCNQSLEITTLEPKTLSSDKQSMEFGNFLPCDKQGKEVDDRNEHSDHLKEKAVGSISTKNADSREEIELDCVVGLACTGGLISNDFLIQVDGFIESHKAFSSTRNTLMQDIPLEPSVNAKNGDPFQDILAKIDSQDSTKQHNGLFPTSHNGSPSTVVADEEHHTAPRGTLWTPFNFSNEGSLSSYQADGHGVAKSNRGSVVQTKGCGPHSDGKGAAIEILFHGLDKDKSTEEALCEQKSHAMEAHSFSSSSSSELEVHVVKAKAGRRIVLSDSESEDGDMQGNCKGGNCQDTHTGIRTNLCNSKESCLPFTGTISMDEQRHDFSVEFRARDTCASSGVENRVSQQSLPRRKQLKVVQSSDPLDDVACKEVSEHSSPRSAEGPKALAINLEGAGVGGIEDGEPTGVRRSKRLRSLSLLKSQSKDPGIPSRKKKIRQMVAVSPNSTETNGSLQGSKESNSEAAHSNTVDNTLEDQGLPSSKKIIRRQVEVSSSSSAGTSGHVEGLPHKRSKRPPRVQRRLFEEVESKPAYGDNHPTDSEDDDSEIESDADSLKDFIVDSEDAEDSRSSDDEQSSSGSHSSRDAFCNPRLGRDIKIRHYVWELEPEMLAALAVNPELCLRAVCAINRRQTEDEQKEKMSKYLNKRGFDKLHAKRGTRIAEFLTDGDPEGPVKKSKEDLNKFDAGGVEFCKMIAAMHSKQLFEIYTNTEDPHFPFS